jgi:NADH-quinone oxidoreductase subunit H
MKIIVIIAPLMLLRRLPHAGRTQGHRLDACPHRTQPSRPLGLLQPIADGLKLFFKEVIVPRRRTRKLFFRWRRSWRIAPALAAWAVVPFSEGWAHLPTSMPGLLYILGDHLHGRLRRDHRRLGVQLQVSVPRQPCDLPAQMVSYEIAMGFALVTVLMVSNSLNLRDIVRAAGQRYASPSMGSGFLSWNWIPLLPMFLVYLISGVAETNRAPFDVVEGESEIVAGHMIEYSGMAFALFFPGRIREHDSGLRR